MINPLLSVRTTWAAVVSALCISSATLLAQVSLSPQPIPLDTLAAFRSPTANWQLGAGLAGDPRTEKFLTPLPGTGVLVNNPTSEHKGDLFTAEAHGDCELELDFLMTPGSNSGVYLMGRYEVQLFDSWGVAQPASTDCGGIYARWDDARGPGQESYEGHPPRANASRAPGLWQHLRIEFRAPRFDAEGKKIASARFLKVVLNGFVIHENIEVRGPTRSAAFKDEAPLGPLMIQGDHGPVAVRAIRLKRFDPSTPTVRLENITCELRTGSSNAPTESNPEVVNAEPTDELTAKPTTQPVTEIAVQNLVKSGRFSAVFSGTLVAPVAGDYLFTAGSQQFSQLTIDGKPAIASAGSANESRPIRLAAGNHSFKLHFKYSGRGRLGLRLLVEGPGLAPQLLTSAAPAPTTSASVKSKVLPIEPTSNRVRLQRSFVPYEPKKRLYAINVGTPTGLHFAYDTETAAILRLWRGGFLDTSELWVERSEDQIAKPTGPELLQPNLPVLALLERTSDSWPDQPDPMATFQSYRLEADGLPVFSFSLATLTATDRIAPLPRGGGVTRTLTVKGDIPDWEPWVLLADALQITPLPDGHRYIIGDRDYYIDVPADSPMQPILRTRHGRQQLVVPVTKASLGQPIVYSLIW